MAKKRLEVELVQINRKQPTIYTVGPISDDNIFVWHAILKGPIGTPYEGGTYKIEILFPTDYPFKPPKAKFVTKIFHPNISEGGEICVDILQSEWSPAITTDTLLLSISSLLGNPNPMDPLNLEAAKLYTTNINKYNEQATLYTRRYAMMPF